MKTRFDAKLGLLVLSAFALSVFPATAADEAAPDFDTHALPLFKQYCAGCHNATDAEHGLVLETYEAVLKGGDDGAVLVPGKADESRILRMLDGRDRPAMPPEGNERPTPEEIARLTAWLDAGAKGPTGAPPDPTLLVTPRIKLLAPARQVVNAVAISADGKLAAIASYREVRLVSTESRTTLRTLAGHLGNVTDVAFSSDGQRLASAAGEPGLFGEAILWHVADGAVQLKIVGHRDNLNAVALSPNGQLLATGSYDQQVKIWDANSGQELRTISGHNGAIYDLAFHPAGRLLASASGDRTIKLWDVDTGERLDTFGQPLREQYAIAFSPDGKHLAGGGVDNRLRVWEIGETAKEGTNPLVLTRFAHEGALLNIAYSRDGKLLATSADDRSLRLWDAPAYTERLLFEPQPDWTPALAFGADNATLLAGRLDGSLAFYNVTNGTVIPPPAPALAAVSPRGVQRGVPTRVKLTGKNLADVRSLKFSRGQFEFKLLESSGEEVAAEIVPAANLPRGAYAVAVETSGGATGEATLHVDDLPQIEEREPNNRADQATVAAAPAGVWGVLAERGDIDVVAFDGKAGQSIVVELAAKRLGSGLVGVLTLLGPTGQALASENGFDGQEDPLLAQRLPTDGRYAVRIVDLQRNGSPAHFYRLTVGEFPYVTGAFPPSVAANAETQVELAGYNLPPDAKAVAKAAGPGALSVPYDVEKFRGLDVKTAARDAATPLEVEPNDQPAEATPLSLPASVEGRIWARREGQTGDADLYRFESAAGQAWIVETEAQRLGTPLDTKIEVLDAEGRPVKRLQLQAVRDSYIEFRPVESGASGLRPKNWEEMELNEYLYLQGEVCKIFRMPQGPDSEIVFYLANGSRRCYFDTSPTAHAIEESVYVVEPHPADARLTPNGLPVFDLFYANDDDGERRAGRDSRLTFTAPAAGVYYVRVSDVRGFGGDRFAYRLTVRPPQPDFQVSLDDPNPTVAAGSGRRLSFSVVRADNFDGDIRIDVGNVPPGFQVSTPVSIQAGQSAARAVLTADPDAKPPTAEQLAKIEITASATIDGQERVKGVNSLGTISLAPKPNLIVRLEPAEVTVVPGTTVTATLKVERNGFNELVTFDVDNLPHGVIVDNIGLNGVLIPAGQSERTIYLTCAKWEPDLDRKFHAVANNAGAQASAAITLKVRKPTALAGN